MADGSVGSNQGSPYPFPRGVFLGGVAVVCLGLALSAGYTFLTLMKLRADYLRNRGREITSFIDMQARGPGRRNNPAFWQELLEDSYKDYAGAVRFFALRTRDGRTLASAGQTSAATSGFATVGGNSVFVFDLPLSPPGQMHAGMSPMIGGWHLSVGIRTSEADSFRRQAYLHLAVTGIAIGTLLLLAGSLLRTLRRFLDLKARAESEKHLRALGTMGAALAHEIRNPLGAMKGLTQLVQEELPPDHSAQVSLRTVVNEAERLEGLVTDLLSFARPKEPRFSEFDLCAVISDVKAMLQPKLEQKGIDIRVTAGDGSMTLRSDEAGLRQVLLNVLLNAIEVTPQGKVIFVNNREVRAGDLVVEVDDAGPGLGDKNPEEFFEPFVTTKAQGTGLGLPVSRLIVKRLGGSIDLQNLPHGGARCSIRLPLNYGRPGRLPNWGSQP